MSIEISKKRHIAKAITWRIIASLTTFLLAMFFFGDDPNAKEKATAIAIAESILKMVLYYFHERAWFQVNFGLISRKIKRK